MTTTYDPATESLDDLTGLGGERGPRHYFGEIAIVDDFDCVLRKGQGKIPFDPGVHRAEERLVALKLKVVCTTREGSTYDLDQDDITSGSKHKVTLASLKELGIASRAQLRALAGKHCQAVRVETGGKYQAKKASADGKIQPGDWIAEQALKFLTLYDSAEQCKAAETQFYAPRGGGVDGGKNAPQPVSAQETDDAATIDAVGRQQLLSTLPVLWQAAGQQVPAFEAILRGNPAYAQHGITLQAPEVTAIIGAPHH